MILLPVYVRVLVLSIYVQYYTILYRNRFSIIRRRRGTLFLTSALRDRLLFPCFRLKNLPARLPPLFRILVTRVPGLPEMFYIRSIFTRYYDNTSIRADRSCINILFLNLPPNETFYNLTVIINFPIQ